jgi:hypothetical protein
MRGLAFRRLHGRRARRRALRRLRWLFASDPGRVGFKVVDRADADRAACSCSICGVRRRLPGAAPPSIRRTAAGPGEWPDIRIGFLRIILP